MKHPPLEEVLQLIREHDRRVGLRILYKAYGIRDAETRARYRTLWEQLESKMEDSFEKKMAAMPPEEIPLPDPREKLIRKIEAHRRRAQKYKEKKAKKKNAGKKKTAEKKGT